MKPIKFVQPIIGFDSEFFFKNDNEIVGAEKEIVNEDYNCQITVDGVAAEFNPSPSYCRELLKRNFRNLINKLHENGKLNKICVKSSIDLTQKELDSLSDNSKVFGCKPSYDVYSNSEPSKIAIKGTDTLQRTAGGHIHIGIPLIEAFGPEGLKKECESCILDCKEFSSPKTDNICTELNQLDLSIHDLKISNKFKKTYQSIFNNFDNIKFKTDEFRIFEALTTPSLTIPLMDLICGIPSVLLDISPESKIRRKLYGKAGDYRLTNYGLEYRTLSNFWIQSYSLFSLFTGLARYAVLLAASHLDKQNNIEEIYKVINKKDVQTVINNNDFEGAKQIFLKLEPFLLETYNDEYSNNLQFNHKRIIVFKQLVMKKWVLNIDSNNLMGNWENSEGWERISDTIYDGFSPKKIQDIQKNFIKFKLD
jgi:hypothetical protein